jgi:phosphoribosylformylglycinamidine synthase subunit PurQ / glutaminase
MNVIRILIITGYGFNCEAESKVAWELAGASPELVHFNDLLKRPARLHDYHALMFIGGFSYGDHMSSGHVFALRVKHRMREDLRKFIDAGKLVLGVCNGFQILVKLGLLPGLGDDDFTQTVSLTQNDCGSFQNYWVWLRFESRSPCVFTRGLECLPLPIRHGEGKLFTLNRELLSNLEARGCVACRYADPTTGAATLEFPHNPNGSLRAIAGLCDLTGKIFGLMPHPEAYLYPENHPQWDFQKLRGELPGHGLGLKIFKNAVDYLRQIERPI